MTRNLKALGLAFIAVFAMSAVAASAAHATEFFHSHKERTIITGEGGTTPGSGVGHEEAHIFTVAPGAAVECKKAKFEGTEVGNIHTEGTKGTTYTTETLTVTPTYAECNLAGNAAVVNTTEGECHYTLFAATTETVAGKPHGNVEVKCAEGKTINISVAGLGLVVHVGTQPIPHILTYANVNTKGGTENEEVTITADNRAGTGGGIAWTCTPKAQCLAALGATSGTEATYTGKVTAKGFVDENTPPHAGVTGFYEEGAQTGIWKGPTV